MVRTYSACSSGSSEDSTAQASHKACVSSGLSGITRIMSSGVFSEPGCTFRGQLFRISEDIAGFQVPQAVNDGNWNSDTAPSDEQIAESLQGAVDKNDISLNVSVCRRHGEGRSAGFELTDRDTGEILFSMDIDVNRPTSPTQIYEVEGLRFRGVIPAQMIAETEKSTIFPV